MEDMRKKATKTNMNQNADKQKNYNENPEKSFVEILKGDHTKESHQRKKQIRDTNVKGVIQYINSHQSQREKEKNKLMLISSNGGEVGGTFDFVDIITPDPFLEAYKSKNNGQLSLRNSNGSLNKRASEDLRNVWQTQIQLKYESLKQQKCE